MPSTYSTSLRFEQQADGENSGTWGQKQNNNHTLLEDAISTGAATTISVAGAADVTLTAANGLTDQSRLAMLRLTGVLTGNINVIVPNTPVNAVKSKWWFVSNETTGAFTLTFKAQGGTGIVVPQGVKNIYWCDATNIVEGLRFISPFATDTGASGTAFVVTPGGTTPGALSTGMRIGFKSAHAATGGASTLNYAGFGTTAFKRLDGSNLQANDFVTSQYVEAGFDGTQWVLLTTPAIPAPGAAGHALVSDGTNWTSSATFPGSATDQDIAIFSGTSGRILADSGVSVTALAPSGAIVGYGGSAAPTGWLLCDGSAVSRSTFAALFTAISTNYGTGDGSTTFNVPDLRSRALLGAGTGTVAETVAAGSVSTGGDTFTVTSNNTKWITGQAVQLTTTGGLPAGLALATTYFLIRASATTIKFASTLANAVAGTAIDITTQGTGNHTLTGTLTARTRGEIGGEETHAQTVSELAVHEHPSGGSAFSVGSTGAALTATAPSTTGNTGGGAAFNVMPPYGVANFIIKT